MNRLGRWTLDRIGFPGLLSRFERDFGKGVTDILAVLVALAAISIPARVVFWVLTEGWK